MKTSSIKAGTILLLAILLSASSAFAAGITARVTNVKGSVESQKGAAWSAVHEGDTVSAGVKLRTGAGGSCLVTWGGGHAMRVTSLTTVSVDQLDKDGSKEASTFSVVQGKVLAKSKQLSGGGSSFHVRTPTAVAGVRGTEFAVGQTEAGSSVQVVDGSVEVAAPGGEPVIVEPGFEVNMVEGMTVVPPPEPIPPAELQELQQGMQEVGAESAAAESSAPPAKEETKSEATSESKDAGTEDVSASGDTGEAPSVDVDSALSTVDQTLNNTATLDITSVSTSEAEYITGTVEVEIHLPTP